MNFIKFSVLILSAYLFVGCSENYRSVFSGTVLPKPENILNDTLIKDSVSGRAFSRLSRPASAGLQFQYDIPKGDQKKKMYVVVGGNIRTNYAFSNSSFAVSVYDNKSNQIAWRALPLRIAYLGINKWIVARDSVLIPANYYSKIPSHVSVHTFLGESKNENFDIDSMFVTIKIADN